MFAKITLEMPKQRVIASRVRTAPSELSGDIKPVSMALLSAFPRFGFPVSLVGTSEYL